MTLDSTRSVAGFRDTPFGPRRRDERRAVARVSLTVFTVAACLAALAVLGSNAVREARIGPVASCVAESAPSASVRADATRLLPLESACLVRSEDPR